MRFCVAAVIAAILLLTAVQQAHVVGPWWVELLRYLPYPAPLVPALFALLASCWLGGRWMLASAATVVVVLTVTMGFEWARAEPGDGVRVRLMTYNIKAYLADLRQGGLQELAHEIARNDPDILVMQDANSPLGAPIAVPQRVLRITTLPNVYTANQYVIASRFPMHDCGLQDAGSLAFLQCTVRVPGGPEVRVVTAHLGSPRNGLNAAHHKGLDGIDDWEENLTHRLVQARSLAAAIATEERPLVVAGDLNAIESSPVIRTLLGAGLRDAFSSAGRGYGYTYGHGLRVGFSFLRIDHVLVSPGIGVRAAAAGGSGASQHRPVIAELVLPAPTRETH